MKKIFSTVILIAGALMFAGCAGEEKDLFEKSAAERLNETGKIYSSRLQSSEAGWVMEYYPTNTDETYKGRGYLIMADFDKDESVTLAMKNIMSDDEYMEERSLWEIIADNGPVLTFNTYNEVLHCFSNPEYYESGKGFEGDYEFVMIDVPEDGQFIMLKGKKRGTYVRLTRLPDGTDFQEYLNDVNAFTKKFFPENVVNEDVLVVGGEKFAINSGSTGIMGMYPYDGDAITETTQHPFLITKRDGNYYLRFRSAIEAGEVEEQEFVYDEAGDRFVGVANNENVISGPDPSVFFRQFMQQGYFWMFTPSSEITGNIATVLQTVVSDFASKKYTVQNIKYSMDGEDARVTVTVRSGSSSVSLVYLYDAEVSDAGISITYREPYVSGNNKRAAQILTTIPTLANFLTGLNGSYKAEKANETGFNLGAMKLFLQDGSTIAVQSSLK